MRTILVSEDNPGLGKIQQAYFQQHDKTTRVIAPVDEALPWDGEAVSGVSLMSAYLPELTYIMTGALNSSGYALPARRKVTSQSRSLQNVLSTT